MKMNAETEIRYGWSLGFPKVFLIQVKNPFRPETSIEVEFSQEETGDLFEALRTNRLIPEPQTLDHVRLG